jgi:hypothetical protein
MTTERSDDVYFHWLESSQKYDYFVAGLCFALVGYLGANLAPSRLGFNAQTLEIAAVVLVLGAAVSGVKRIAAMVELLRIGHGRLYAEESAGFYKSVALTGGPTINESTGDVMSPSQALALAAAAASSVTKQKSLQDSWLRTGEQWYLWRDRLLLVGLGLLILSRVLRAYGS